MLVFPARGLVLVREPLDLSHLTPPVVALRIHPQASRLVVTAGYYPTGIATVLVAGLGCVLLLGPAVPPLAGVWPVLAVACAMTCQAGYERAERYLKTGVMEIEARIARARQAAEGGFHLPAADCETVATEGASSTRSGAGP